ncbi:hypothetical protein ACTGVN_02885 [Streptococcus suis]
MKKTFVTLATVAALGAVVAPLANVAAFDNTVTHSINQQVKDFGVEYAAKYTELLAAQAVLDGAGTDVFNKELVINDLIQDIAQKEANIVKIEGENRRYKAILSAGLKADATEQEKADFANAQNEVTLGEQLLEVEKIDKKNMEGDLAFHNNELATLKAAQEAARQKVATLQGELDAIVAKASAAGVSEEEVKNGAAAPAENGAAANNGGAAAPAGNGAAANNGKAAAKTVAAAKTETGAKTLPKTSAAK